jgi:hypothetical protein
VHSLTGAAAHLVPIVACHFQLSNFRHFNLRERQQVIKAGFSRDFLFDKPPHLLQISLRRQPRKEWVSLSWPGLAEAFKPSDEGIHLIGNIVRQRCDFSSNRLNKLSFRSKHAALLVELNAPCGRRQRRLQALSVEFCEFTMEKGKATSIEVRCKFDPFNIFYIVR